jgi:hypothetical protein
VSRVSSADTAAHIHALVADLAAELNDSDFRLGCPVIAAGVASPDAVSKRRGPRSSHPGSTRSPPRLSETSGPSRTPAHSPASWWTASKARTCAPVAHTARTSWSKQADTQPRSSPRPPDGYCGHFGHKPLNRPAFPSGAKRRYYQLGPKRRACYWPQLDLIALCRVPGSVETLI